MYLKQSQIAQIRDAIEEIKSIASMENTDLHLSEEDTNKVKLWATWFTSYANQIEDALNGELRERYK